MGTLFELTNDMQTLYEMTTDPEIDLQALEDTIQGVLGMIEKKAGGYAHVIKTLEMEQAKAKEISQVFAEKAKIRENNVKRMKEMLLLTMDKLEITELPADEFTIKIQRNGGQEPLVIDDVAKVPDSLTKITIEPDKNKIREYLKNNEADFAHIEPRGRHIVIK